MPQRQKEEYQRAERLYIKPTLVERCQQHLLHFPQQTIDEVQRAFNKYPSSQGGPSSESDSEAILSLSVRGVDFG